MVSEATALDYQEAIDDFGEYVMLFADQLRSSQALGYEHYGMAAITLGELAARVMRVITTDEGITFKA